MKTEWLRKRFEAYYSKEEIERIFEGYQERYPSFRVNTLKTTTKEVKKILEDLGFQLGSVTWYPDAFLVYNKSEKDLETLEIYQEGKIYLQSLSSMLPVSFLNPKERETILDMAAAPGSKTTQIGIITQNKASITACEKNKIRVERLKYNLQKQGITCCSVLSMDARQLNDLFRFDKVLIDAPCLGTGTLQKDSLEDNLFLNDMTLTKITKTQSDLLRKGLKLLKKDGILVYSTCSVLKEENEALIYQIQKEFDLEILPIEIPDIPLLTSSIPNALTVCPSKEYEGFFVIKMKKNS